jgi:hypothetical protein
MAKLPPYVIHGLYLLVVRESDGNVGGLPIALDDDVTDIAEAARTVYVDLAVAGSGMREPTEAEYVAYCGELAAQHQASELRAAMHGRMKHVALNPKRLDAILAAHRGRPGGDA